MNITKKKEYIAPAIVIEEVEHESLMTTTSSETTDTSVGSGTAGNGPDLTNRRRGSWGNLWE